MPRCCMLAALQTQRLHWRPYLESRFGALRTAGFSIADVSPKSLLHGLRLLAWSQPWFPVPAATPSASAPVEAAGATAEGSSGKKKSGKDTKAAPSAAAPSATEAETAGVPPTKPAKAGKPAKGGDSGGKNAGAAMLPAC